MTPEESKEKKESKSSYISPSRVLTRPEYKEYRELKKQSQKEKYMRRMESLRKENRYSQVKRNYETSRSGKFSKFVVRAGQYVRNPSRHVYARYSRPVSNPQKTLLMQRMRAIQQQRQQERYRYDWIFCNFKNPSTNYAGIVENELTGKGYNHVNCGDFEALSMSVNRNNNPFSQLTQEVNHHSSIGHIPAVNSTSFDAIRHSQNIIVDPIISTSRDALFFSNLLF